MINFNKTLCFFFLIIFSIPIFSEDQNLAKLYEMVWDSDARGYIISVINDKSILTQIAKTEGSDGNRKKAVSKLDDQKVLAWFAKYDNDKSVRSAAIEKLNDQDVLFNIAQDEELDNQLDAIKKITDLNKLSILAHTGETRKIKIGAIKNIFDKKILSEIIQNSKDSYIIEAAKFQLLNQNELLTIIKAEGDMDLRLEALKRISDQSVLNDLALNSPEHEIRLQAISKLSDQNILAEIAKNDDESVIRKKAVEKLNPDNWQETFTFIAENDEDPFVRLSAMSKLKNEDLCNDLLISEAKKNNDMEVRRAYLFNVIDQNVIADIAKNDESVTVRVEAVIKLNPDQWQNLLIDIAKNDEHGRVRELATYKITDDNTLYGIAKSDKDIDVRCAATIAMSDKEKIFEIIQNDTNSSFCKRAAYHLNDIEKIKYLSLNHNSSDIRKALESTEVVEIKGILVDQNGKPISDKEVFIVPLEEDGSTNISFSYSSGKRYIMNNSCKTSGKWENQRGGFTLNIDLKTYLKYNQFSIGVMEDNNYSLLSMGDDISLIIIPTGNNIQTINLGDIIYRGR